MRIFENKMINFKEFVNESIDVNTKWTPDTDDVKILGSCSEEINSMIDKIKSVVGENNLSVDSPENASSPNARAIKVGKALLQIKNKINTAYSEAGREQDSPFYNK